VSNLTLANAPVRDGDLKADLSTEKICENWDILKRENWAILKDLLILAVRGLICLSPILTAIRIQKSG